MGLSFKSIGRVLKRAARSKIVQGGLSVATGGLSDKVLSVGKALGAAVTGNKMLKKQQKAVTAATEKLRNLPAPGVVGMATGSTGDGTAWINQKTAGSSRPKAAKGKKRRVGRTLAEAIASKKARANVPQRKGETEVAWDKRARKLAAAKAAPKKAKKSGGGGRTPPKQTDATKKKFAANADAIKKKGAAWKKMSDAQKKAAGGWKSFAFGK